MSESFEVPAGCMDETNITVKCFDVWFNMPIYCKNKSKGLPTPSKSEREREKDQRTIGKDQKNARQISKEIFTFVFAFVWCG